MTICILRTIAANAPRRQPDYNRVGRGWVIGLANVANIVGNQTSACTGHQLLLGMSRTGGVEVADDEF